MSRKRTADLLRQLRASDRQARTLKAQIEAVESSDRQQTQVCALPRRRR